MRSFEALIRTMGLLVLIVLVIYAANKLGITSQVENFVDRVIYNI
jgi:hypothetical protein